MEHLLFIGPPGAGKGTIAKKLDQYIQVSTGDLLRAEQKKNSELGKYISDLINNGNFVDDETMFKILKLNLPKNQALIFDGYPRNKEQIKYFEKLINDIDPKAKIKVIHFEISLEKLEERLVNRRTCSSCGEIYNLKNKIPKKYGICNLCNGSLQQRRDDNKETVSHRLKTYQKLTEPILNYYRNKDYIRLDANQSIEFVEKDLKEILCLK